MFNVSRSIHYIYTECTFYSNSSRFIRRRKTPSVSIVYRMNWNRGIFFRLATSGSESVSARKHLEIPSILSTIIPSVSKAEKRAEERRAGEFSEMNKDGYIYGDGPIKIRAFPRLAFSTSSGRRYHVAGSALRFSSCVSRQFNFREKNKALGVASFSRHRPVAFASGDSRERANEPWEISDRRDRSHKVNWRC